MIRKVYIYFHANWSLHLRFGKQQVGRRIPPQLAAISIWPEGQLRYQIRPTGEAGTQTTLKQLFALVND
jgi:hypothetical protein